MSVQFGRWNFDNQPVVPEDFEKVHTLLAPYGVDSKETYSIGGLTILYRAYHTNKESRREKQPYISASGAVITWDGRLDNRMELIREVQHNLTPASTDVEIVAASFEKWGLNCFKRLIGDWALSIWDPNNHCLFLVKDPIGTRHLYYSVAKDSVSWSSTLDPLVLFAGKEFDLCEEYIAGWFATYPAPHLTPYVGILSVPPSSSVCVRPGKHTISKFWNFDPQKKINYRTDREYEDHFRDVFAKAVQRRLRSDSPVLAELSGGRDSSSIVCMADTIISAGDADCPRLDTFSYYDDSEPNWDERPYFTKVEQKRGRSGWHVNAQNSETPPELETAGPRHVPLPNYPGYDGRTSAQLRACMMSYGNRVLLSGIGGDEVMGGVPTPAPELQDLIATAQFGRLARQLKLWALQKKQPWVRLFWEAARDFLPIALFGVPSEMRCPTWLQPSFVRRQWAALHGYVSRTRLFGPRPSFQASLSAFESLQRQLAQAAPAFEPPFEKRYPFLDRDLLEFMFAIPREQLVRPTQRRSLMRRALVGIVPDEILNRKSKAFVARAPRIEIARDWDALSQMMNNMVSESIGIVDSKRFFEVLQRARRGDDDEVPMLTVRRTLFIEGWLKEVYRHGRAHIHKYPNANLAWVPSSQA